MSSRKLTCASGFSALVSELFFILLSKFVREDLIVLHELDRTLVGGCGSLFDAEHGREHNFACNIIKADFY